MSGWTNDRNRVDQILKDEVIRARHRLDVASAEYDEVVAAVSSGSPHANGIIRIQDVSIAYTRAREDMMIAIRRQNDFLIDGTVPDDLK